MGDSTDPRRSDANMRERLRMGYLNKCFDQLREIINGFLENPKDRKLSKVQVLKYIFIYAREMERIIRRISEAELAELQRNFLKYVEYYDKAGQGCDVDCQNIYCYHSNNPVYHDPYRTHIQQTGYPSGPPNGGQGPTWEDWRSFENVTVNYIQNNPSYGSPSSVVPEDHLLSYKDK